MQFLKRIGAWTVAGCIVLGTASCENTQLPADPLPFVYVRESVYLNELRALPLLQQNGNFIYVPGGLKGICLYRQAPGQFAALERQSPAREGCQVSVSITRQYLSDSCSNSTFSFEGALITGRASANLRRYQVSFDGNLILITN